jgi:copper chaperone CopZ
MKETWTFEVIGSQQMHCEGCENAVQRSLTRLPGISQVQADHHTQRIVVQVDTAQTTASAITARLETAGYQVSQLS